MRDNATDFDDYRDFERREAADKNVYVKFYTRPVRDDAESDAQGRPIFRDREYVEIRTPGQQNNVIQRPVTDMDRQRFRPAYQLFQKGHAEQDVGTPLEQVPWITRSQVEELAYLRVRTVEHLANMNDVEVGKYPGMHKLKQNAIKYLESAAGQAPITDLQRQIDELKQLVETQNITIRDQSSIIERLKTTKE